jgi:cytochrome c nitrite reductase small subunit
MAPQFATWSHSSHHSTATCNDCHVPHNNFLNKYFYKAKDGARHATVFTLRNEPQVIFIKKAGIQVAQNNCFRCHEKIFPDNFQQRLNKEIKSNEKERLCWDCHRETPHGRINSLSAVPFARVPLPQSPVPDWLKSLMK